MRNFTNQRDSSIEKTCNRDDDDRSLCHGLIGGRTPQPYPSAKVSLRRSPNLVILATPAAKVKIGQTMCAEKSD
jgi:hypothetical protein